MKYTLENLLRGGRLQMVRRITKAPIKTDF